MPAESQNPQTSMAFLLHDVARLLRKDFNLRTQSLGLGLTLAQWRALAHLSRNQGINHATLADLLEVQPITLTRLIDRLEAAGLVERRDDPGDRRAQRLLLTQAAKPLMEQLWSMAAETSEVATEGLSVSAREHVVEVLQTMKSNLLSEQAPDAAQGRRHPAREVRPGPGGEARND